MARQIQFGDWIFDPEAGQLQLGNDVQRIEPRVARLLEHFLSHQNNVFTHSQLIDAVWDGRVVSDAAVRRCVSALRRNLARDGSQHCIRTIPKKGYLGCFPPALTLI